MKFSCMSTDVHPPTSICRRKLQRRKENVVYVNGGQVIAAMSI
jgi:hypothetical protein